MERKIEEEKDDIEISIKNELICLILRKMDLITLNNLIIYKMVKNDGK